MEADFGGWATKAGLKCSDGVTIMRGAFQHMDKQQVPLVWAHSHNNPDNVLGHAVLQNREEGVYAHAFFNDTKQGKNAKALVQHGDIKSLSIFANQLTKSGQNVVHGMIREVSLVLAGANPGAVIDYVQLAHGDGVYETLDESAVIHTGTDIENVKLILAEADEPVEHADAKAADTKKESFDDVYETFNEKQKELLHFMVGRALETVASKNDDSAKGDSDKPDTSKNAAHSDKPAEGDIAHQEGADDMSRNVFDQTDANKGVKQKNELSHADVQGIVQDALKCGSLKEAVEAYAISHGITSIDTLFPDAKTLADQPEFNKRRTEWVPGVLNGVRRSPFSRVKTIMADLTMDEARAKGYIKGNFKKEEWFGVTKRTTTPTTVYKKQQLDRDDVVDIVDFDVVAWIRAEMRMMLEEELARAILIGDGRDVSNEDKIKDPMAAADGSGIRSILHEHELYATTVNVNLGTVPDYYEVVKSVLRARRFYKGTGRPTFYTTSQTLVEMLLAEDGFGRPRWDSPQALAAALMVDSIVEVEVMEDEPNLLGIMVNLSDYNVGADKGGEVSLFDDFDIDYNQYKYLIETRISGALVKLKAALIITKTVSSNQLVDPTVPTFVETTGVVTIPAKTGVVYKNGSTTLTAGAQTALTAGSSMVVDATPASGYYFSTNAEDQWTFVRPVAQP